jgi:hypothetical protein
MSSGPARGPLRELSATVAVSSGPGMRAPESATINEVKKIAVSEPMRIKIRRYERLSIENTGIVSLER